MELRTYADPRWREGTFLDMLDYLYETEGMGMPRDGLVAFLRDGGRAVVVFDGLDEVFDPRLREQVTRQIEAFAARYPQVRVMVTSRVIGYQRAILDAAGFSHYMLQDLDMGQIREFTTGWYRSSWPDNLAEASRLGNRLLGAVQESAAVAELAGNPMLLTILAIIGRRQELPRDRRTVYEHAVSVLVEHWDATGKHLRDERVDSGMPYLRHEDKLELLRLVARRMQDGPAGLSGNYLPGPELLSEFDAYLRERFELPADRAIPAATSMLRQLRERNFILAQFGAGVYGFVHRAFLEYLAAADIYQRFAARDLSEGELIQVFSRRWADPAWQEVLLLITGMISEKFAARVIDCLLDADPSWDLHPDRLPRHVLLAVRCLGEVRKTGALATQSRAIARTLISVLEAGADEMRLAADQSNITALEKAILPVLSALGPHWAGRRRYEDWYLTRGQFQPTGPGPVRSSWLALASRMTAALFPPNEQTRHLLRDWAALAYSPGARRAAVEALAAGWREDPETAPLLRERATTDTDQNVRQAAAGALAAGWREDPAMAPWLRERATTDTHPDVRRAAAGALAAGWREDPETAPLLRERATTDTDQYVRRAVVEALAAGWRGDPGPPRCCASAPPPTLTRSSGGLRWRRWPRAGGRTRRPPRCCVSVPPPTPTRTSGRLRRGRWPRAGGRTRRPPRCCVSVPPPTPTRTSGRLRRGRWPRAGGRTRRWPPGCVSAPPPTPTRTSGGLRRGRWPRAGGRTRRWPPGCASAPPPTPTQVVREAAVDALAAGWREDPETAPLLRERATTDTAPVVRWAAVDALAAGWRDDPETAPLLRERATTDTDQYVRRAAAGALAAGWRGDPETAPLLRERATTDTDPVVRRAAVEALAAGWREDPETAPLLRERATADTHPDVRRAAVEALAAGWREDPETGHLLRERATTDTDRHVRRAAVGALAAAGGPTRPWPPGCASAPPPTPTRTCAGRRCRRWPRLAGGPGHGHLAARARHHRHRRERAPGRGGGAGRGWRDDPATADLLRERATTDTDPVRAPGSGGGAGRGWR